MDLERKILGTILLDPSVLSDNPPKPEHFPDPECRRVYVHMLSMFKQDRTIVPDLLAKHCEKEWLAGNMELAVSPGYYFPLLRQLKDAFHRKALRETGEALSRRVDDGFETQDIIKRLGTTVEDIERDRAEPVKLTTAEDVEHALQLALNPRIPDFPSGLQKIDVEFGGFQRKELVVVYGDTSHGKSTLMYTFARTSIFEGKRLLIADYEMGKDLIYQRMMAMLSHINLKDMYRGQLNEENKTRARKAADELRGMPIQVLASPSMAQLKEQMASFKPDLVILDYVQLAAMMMRDKDENLSTAITDIMQTLKNMTMMNDCCIFVGSQVVKGYGAGRPRLKDIKESGAIAQSADKVICAYWPAKKGQTQDREAYLIGFDKNKNGPTASKAVQIQQDWLQIVDPIKVFNESEVARWEES